MQAGNTDFSPSATNAAFFAGKLALDQHAQLILLHAYQGWPDDPAKTGDFPQDISDARDHTEASLQHVADKLTTELGTLVPIRCLAQEGHALAVIQRVTKTEGADLLIMSTVGTAPQSDQLMGSLATEMVAKAEVPLLLIPPGTSYMGVRNIVLGIDLTVPPDAIRFDSALTFARSFGSTLHVLCISDTPDKADTRQRAAHIRDLLGQQPHTLTVAAGENVYETLLQFAHAHEADLIMMLPQLRKWLQNLFSEGETQRMARLTDIPLLAVV